MNFPSCVTSHLQCDILSITNVPLSSTGECLLFGLLIQRSVSTKVEDSDLGIEKPSYESRMLAILGNDKHILKEKCIFSLRLFIGWLFEQQNPIYQLQSIIIDINIDINLLWLMSTCWLSQSLAVCIFFVLASCGLFRRASQHTHPCKVWPINHENIYWPKRD